jgi:hypothetical protein
VSDFKFLSKYVFDSPKGIDHKSVKHTLIKLEQLDITNIKEYIEIPHELNEFWDQIGYGFSIIRVSILLTVYLTRIVLK